jgi:hypothetical protein
LGVFNLLTEGLIAEEDCSLEIHRIIVRALSVRLKEGELAEPEV